MGLNLTTCKPYTLYNPTPSTFGDEVSGFFGLGLVLGPGVGPYFLFLGQGFPCNPLDTRNATLVVPRLLLGLVSFGRAEPKMWPDSLWSCILAFASFGV